MTPLTEVGEASMGAEVVPVRGQLSFWRIVDIPFEPCAAALDNWQRTALGGAGVRGLAVSCRGCGRRRR